MAAAFTSTPAPVVTSTVDAVINRLNWMEGYSHSLQSLYAQDHGASIDISARMVSNHHETEHTLPVWAIDTIKGYMRQKQGFSFLHPGLPVLPQFAKRQKVHVVRTADGTWREATADESAPAAGAAKKGRKRKRDQE